MDEVDIICPKCGCGNVQVRCLSVPKRRKVSMDDLGKHTFIIEPALLVLKKYEAKCGECGYTREYMA